MSTETERVVGENNNALLSCSDCEKPLTGLVKCIEECGNLICGDCYDEIKDRITDSREYLCMACSKNHVLSEEGLWDKKVISIQEDEPVSEEALKELDKKLEDLLAFDGIEHINKQFDKLETEVVEAYDGAITQINQTETSFFSRIKEYRATRYLDYNNKRKNLEAELKEGTREIEEFVKIWESQLANFTDPPDEEKAKEALKLAEEYVAKIDEIHQEAISELNCTEMLVFERNDEILKSLNFVGELVEKLPAIEVIIESLNEKAENNALKDCLAKIKVLLADDDKAKKELIGELANLSALYLNFKDPKNSMLIQKKVLEIQRTLSESNQSEVSRSMNKIANRYTDIGRYKMAIVMHEELLERRRAIFKNDPFHPEIADSLNNLALCHREIGEHAEAERLNRQALEIRKAFYSDQPDHPDIADSLTNLATCLSDQNDHAKALELHQQALVMRRRFYKDVKDHPSIADSLSNLALTYRDLEKHHEAIELHEEALEMRSRLYGCHEDVADSLNDLAASHSDVSDWAKAVDLHKKALHVYMIVYQDQPEHPKILSSRNNLIMALRANGNFKEANDF